MVEWANSLQNIKNVENPFLNLILISEILLNALPFENNMTSIFKMCK